MDSKTTGAQPRKSATMSHLSIKNIKRYGLCTWVRVLYLFVWCRFKEAFFYAHTSPIHFTAGMIGLGWCYILLNHDVVSIGNFYSHMEEPQNVMLWAYLTGGMGVVQILRSVFVSRDCCSAIRPIISGLALALWGSVAVAACSAEPISTAAAAYGSLSIALTWALVRELIENGQIAGKHKPR